MTEKIKVFVYGTLKPQESNYQNYCADKITESIDAYTFGRLYHLPSLGYPAMTEGRDMVRGYLFTFVDRHIIDRLDELETYSPSRPPEENEYQRRLITVYRLTHQPIQKVWAYFMALEKIELLKGVLVPSGCWAQTKFS
jgi:gamma-glutamylcyclotransferase (GGCT)/AIG2-like uncharacterized protein YtfP